MYIIHFLLWIAMPFGYTLLLFWIFLITNLTSAYDQIFNISIISYYNFVLGENNETASFSYTIYSVCPAQDDPFFSFLSTEVRPLAAILRNLVSQSFHSLCGVDHNVGRGHLRPWRYGSRGNVGKEKKRMAYTGRAERQQCRWAGHSPLRCPQAFASLQSSSIMMPFY